MNLFWKKEWHKHFLKHLSKIARDERDAICLSAMMVHLYLRARDDDPNWDAIYRQRVKISKAEYDELRLRVVKCFGDWVCSLSGVARPPKSLFSLITWWGVCHLILVSAMLVVVIIATNW